MADASAGLIREDGGVPEPEPPPTVSQLIESGRDSEAARQGAAVPAGTRPPTNPGGPMDPLTQLERLAPSLGAVVDGIRPDQLDRPTPCADYTVRGVLEHMIGGATAFAAGFRGTDPIEPDLSDPLTGLPAALGSLFEAISAPGALDGTIAAPFGEVPRDTFARFVVLDGIVHGWDMATATGQDYEPDPALVAEVEAFARQALDPLRDGQTFADAVEPAPGASPIEQLAAYTGRRPIAR